MAKQRQFSFTAEVWDYQGGGSWHFVTVPANVADDIRSRTIGRTKGFGSVPVAAVIGATAWETSVFPDKQSGLYVLPLKKAVRQAEGLGPGDRVKVDVTLRL